ncbi:hypothetical protein T265_10337 [Opisthorchis viverrini]|uniref:Uncharacterized protein n=1 Tax=Opisthorchis viverrini TaxID=6198 RepID=A0A074Z2U4_OPIVI|nr:hypothetical protein T265_10337 [Opisthorchis viverrini]KER21308.1 hypothetical protein T265_10337 [Opisthorchis viverrini]
MSFHAEFAEQQQSNQINEPTSLLAMKTSEVTTRMSVRMLRQQDEMVANKRITILRRPRLRRHPNLPDTPRPGVPQKCDGAAAAVG